MSSDTLYELIAHVDKTRGLEGEVTASFASGLPFCMHEGLQVHVVPPTLYGPRKLHIESVSNVQEFTCQVKFQEISDINDAEELVGRSLLALKDDLVFEDGYFEDDILGSPVVDERYGDLGTVTEIIQTPANEVWVLDGPYGEVLVPVIDSTVLEIPEDPQQPIRMSIMDGLIEGGPAGEQA